MDTALIEAKARERVNQKGTASKRIATWGADIERVHEAVVKDAEVMEVDSANEDVKVVEMALGDEAD